MSLFPVPVSAAEAQPTRAFGKHCITYGIRLRFTVMVDAGVRGFASAAGVDFGLPTLPNEEEAAPSHALNLIETHSTSVSDESSSSSDSVSGVSSPELAKKKRKSKGAPMDRNKRHSKVKKWHTSRSKSERIPSSVPGLYEVDTVPDTDSLRCDAH
jgi:hypothetical protein